MRRLSHLSRWNSIVELVEQKKDQLDSMLRLQNYLLECAEIKSQIQDKRKAIDATQYVGSDLGGVLALQRRLSTMEGALSVLEPKLLHLQVGHLHKNIWRFSAVELKSIPKSNILHLTGDSKWTSRDDFLYFRDLIFSFFLVAKWI